MILEALQFFWTCFLPFSSHKFWSTFWSSFMICYNVYQDYFAHTWPLLFIDNFEIFRKIEPRKIVQFKQYLIDLLVDSTDPWLGLLAVKVLVLYFALLQPKNLEEQRNFISAFLVYMQTIIQSGQSERVLCTIQLLAFLLQRFPAFRLYLVKISPILLSMYSHW